MADVGSLDVEHDGQSGRQRSSRRRARVVTFAVIAMAEVGRAVRFITILFGAWLVAAPFLLTGFTPAALVNGIIVGFALIVLSFLPGRIRGSYGSWQPYIV
ncbi:MAG: hypothetical protein M3388_07720 [Acidobacteriota bacterium]|nr:hypothetical protein [Acidobacteriota bacterium]